MSLCLLDTDTLSEVLTFGLDDAIARLTSPVTVRQVSRTTPKRA